MQPFDVVVSNMGIGAGMNGWELAEVVRTRWPGVRLLLAMGWGAAIGPGEASAKGVEAVPSKPYHPAELPQALSRTDAAASRRHCVKVDGPLWRIKRLVVLELLLQKPN